MQQVYGGRVSFKIKIVFTTSAVEQERIHIRTVDFATKQQ